MTTINQEAAIQARRDRIKALINSAGGRFAAVDFVKKDGTLRTLQVQPAALKFHLVGDAASDAAKRATETRKANNPNLLPVWDVANQAVRSINLDTVLGVTVDNQRYEEFA
jgi:hypothetical protein